MRSFKRFVAETTTDEQMKTIRDALVAVIASGAMDALIKRDLMKEERSDTAVSNIYTHSAANDATRFAIRVGRLKRGLVALLTTDDRLDDALLKRYGIAASDIRSENSDPDREVLKTQQDNLKRASLRNKSQQLRVKQAQVQSDIRKVATDIAKVGQRAGR